VHTKWTELTLQASTRAPDKAAKTSPRRFSQAAGIPSKAAAASLADVERLRNQTVRRLDVLANFHQREAHFASSTGTFTL
jgi:hypothetical protein